MPSPEPLAVRFWRKVEKTDGCWIWTGGRARAGRGDHGYYGTIGYGKSSLRAHRASWLLEHGSLPQPGTELDHLCRNTLCVRPDHLEAVTHRQNLLRGSSPSAVNAQKAACYLGHRYTPESTYRTTTGGRQCRPCNIIRWRRATLLRATERWVRYL